ncbi:MAG: hypothetical protein QOF72_863 [Blastocatellia bacterium]|jgi:hypothetical protein|nr:hypothetical protein [Blastocatellia bacterium]
MRLIMLIVISVIGFVGSSFAQQSAPKAKAAKDPKKCTYEACVQRGVQKMGYSSSIAGDWCSKNNNGC